MFLPNWRYYGGDPGLRLFTLANPLLPSAGVLPRVLEIGAHDTDWSERARLLGCFAVGVDWRAGCDIRADVLTWQPWFAPAVVISLSAIEHVGLGRYESDPLDADGDIKAIERARKWLAPGGFIYFDVPYTPEGYQLFQKNKCRCYDDQSLLERFGPHQVLGYTNLSVTGWIDKPTRNNKSVGGRPFYYVALLITKD